MERIFLNRAAAGRALAQHLQAYAQRPDVIVLALPRGGVPVGFEVATALNAPLDVLMVRKLGVPWQTELAMGAIASGGALHVDRRLMREAGVSEAQFESVLADAQRELARREALYREHQPAADVAGRTAIVVDDGMATGATLLAALRALRGLGERAPAKLVAALPVAPADAEDRLGDAADEFVCALTPPVFFSVGQFYLDFGETTDDDVRALLGAAFMPPRP
ncbi:phosphoribosyltransferase [Paraburkholderia phenazinium]|jgi:putative phosphoribosyl transferase|uniref:Predicted phosphoribosyltransferase n=1 Tax=Paraburkholderia phenazinium TaxID=60549 RepID=A0A1G7UDQ1_9BURK|nr:phosphoribosyltransferase family protein [Paraburkholderia phenazinium]SDG45716.1 Predicted phosphoribosyltransferase [Paraburkholderia phenazinium]